MRETVAATEKTIQLQFICGCAITEICVIPNNDMLTEK